MLAKSFRVNESVDFQNIMRKGRRVMFVPGVKIFSRSNTLGYNRFGFVVSKKVGNSVVRHHVTRILREVAKNNLEGSTDYIVLALPDFEETFDAVKLARFLKKAS